MIEPKAAADLALELAWPPLDSLVMPRNEAGDPASPILAALAVAAEPWFLMAIGHGLRTAKLAKVPCRAEAEYAAALHYLVSYAVKAQPGEAFICRARDDLIKAIEATGAADKAAAGDAKTGEA